MSASLHIAGGVSWFEIAIETERRFPKSLSPAAICMRGALGEMVIYGECVITLSVLLDVLVAFDR